MTHKAELAFLCISAYRNAATAIWSS